MENTGAACSRNCSCSVLWPRYGRYGRIMRLWPQAAARLMARNCSNQFGHNYPENHGAWSSWYGPRLCKEMQLNTRVTQCDDYLILWEGPNCILLVETFIPMCLHALTTSSRKKAQSSVQSGINDVNQGQTGGGGYVRWPPLPRPLCAQPQLCPDLWRASPEEPVCVCPLSGDQPPATGGKGET